MLFRLPITDWNIHYVNFTCSDVDAFHWLCNNEFGPSLADFNVWVNTIDGMGLGLFERDVLLSHFLCLN